MIEDRESFLGENWEDNYMVSFNLCDVEQGRLLKYKNGNKENYTFEENLGFNILELLEKNGFPMDLVGTYLYKEVIKNSILFLMQSDKEATKLELRSQLLNIYSQFYFDIARNDMDMGVKTFHQYIQMAISRVDFETLDSQLLMEDGQDMDFHYGNLAYGMAFHLLGGAYQLREEYAFKHKTRVLSSDLNLH